MLGTAQGAQIGRNCFRVIRLPCGTIGTDFLGRNPRKKLFSIFIKCFHCNLNPHSISLFYKIFSRMELATHLREDFNFTIIFF